MANTSYLIRNIEEQYNPDHDMPEGVQVTWVDHYLLQMIQDLQADVKELKAEKEELARRIDHLEDVISERLDGYRY